MALIVAGQGGGDTMHPSTPLRTVDRVRAEGIRVKHANAFPVGGGGHGWNLPHFSQITPRSDLNQAIISGRVLEGPETGGGVIPPRISATIAATIGESGHRLSATVSTEPGLACEAVDKARISTENRDRHG